MKIPPLRFCFSSVLVTCGAMLCFLTGCGKNSEDPMNAPERTDKKLVIVTTTTMVTDLVQQVAGDAFEIKPLMGPGVDPHLYKPTQEDVGKLNKANVIIYSGLHLEGKMTEIFRHCAEQGKITLALGEQLPADRVMKINNETPDPHFWGDANLWSLPIPALVKALSKAIPARTEDFQRRGREAQNRLREAHTQLKDRVDELPHRSRTLITSHDAFRYFGAAYGFDVVGVQGISTDSEAGLNDVARVIDLIKQRQIKAIFVESSVAPATIQRISKDSGAIIGGELLSDALGQPGEMIEINDKLKVDRGTVIGMLHSNMQTVIQALKP